MMTVLDIFSWLPAKEISLAEIEEIILGLNDGKSGFDGFTLERALPSGADDCVREAVDELLGEGKKVCFLMKGGRLIAAAGYRD